MKSPFTIESEPELETEDAFEVEDAFESEVPEDPRFPPLLSCPDAEDDLGALRNALAILTKRLNTSPLDRSRINNARLDFVAEARRILQSAKGGRYVRGGCKRTNLARLSTRVGALRSGLPLTSSRRATLNAVMAAVTKAAQSAPRGEEMEGEVGDSAASQLEWTEDELQYSIINSPTSPGDDRFRITPRSKRPSTLMFPFNTVCLLERQNSAGTVVSRVSGTLIAPQVVLTAAHCLANLRDGTVIRSIRVSPGADLSAARDQRPADPASITAPASRFRRHANLDFGVIILPSAFRRPVQFMRLRPRGEANTATLLTIAGYPCDKPQGTMWGHSEKIRLADISAKHLRYVIDTCPGHSGSPIWLLGNNAIRLLLGVHTNGPAGCVNDPASGSCRRTGAAVTPVAGLNGGVRVTCEVIDQILAWCRELRVTPPTADPFYRQRCTR